MFNPVTFTVLVDAFEHICAILFLFSGHCFYSLTLCFIFILLSFKYFKFWLGTVAYTCNPSYLGDRDWEDYSSRLAQAKSS
jgi:hypothetical protein